MWITPGYMDNEEIPDSSVEDYNMLIGSGIFFNGAESELIGVMPGETVDISVTYPEGYPQADLVGKSAVYKVTVNYIVQEEQAQLTDEFVASISDCETVDEYRQMIRDNLEASRENEREMNRRNAVWDQVLETLRSFPTARQILTPLFRSIPAMTQQQPRILVFPWKNMSRPIRI